MEDTRRRDLFQELVNEHGDSIRRLCFGYERSAGRREELEQEILLNLWKALPGFRGDASLRTWMYRVAHNTAARHCHRAIREPTSGESVGPVEEQSSGAAHLEEVAERERMKSRLHELIGQLRPLDRQMMLLYLEDVSQGEIAEITGLSVANVSTRIHRIKADITRSLSR